MATITKRIHYLFWVGLVFFLTPPQWVAATHIAGHNLQTPGINQTTCPPNKLCNPIKYANLEAFLLAILDVVVKYGAILIVFFIVYAGFQFVTAQGNTEKIATAKKTLIWVVVGAFVLLGVYVIRAAICGTLIQIGVTNLQC